MWGGELKNIFKVWILVLASLSYCHLMGRRIPEGKLRLISFIPVFCLFLLLPLNFSSIQLRGFTALFLAWLANFKLLLFAFGKGPLSHYPSMKLLHFVSIASFPIKIKPSVKIRASPTDSSGANAIENKNNHPFIFPTKLIPNTPMFYAIKAMLIAVLARFYDSSEHSHPLIRRIVITIQIYLGMEFTLTTVAYLTKLKLGLELEPQFREPYLSTSLQDFWSRRWNLMVSKILHPTIYEPSRHLIAHFLGNDSQMPSVLAIISTFFVSGVMHELLLFYMGCWESTGKTMFYFALHGVCLAAEVSAKKALAGRWQLHPAVSWYLAGCFTFGTICWLLLPDLLQCQMDIKVNEEFKAFEQFLKDVGGYVAHYATQR